ncbi:nitroreductase family protein [Thiobacter aerophilum]|uniref:Nitroreductase family protein n=1 Tax=Thiobacter aerophilum TaxID=3121275 RepID=A0ABV0ECF2_9BURK
MDVRTAIEMRRSIKGFDPQHRMTEEEIETLMGLTILSPTAFNIQHWRFVLVRDPVLRTEIRKLAWDQPQVTDASLLVILCADLKAWQKDPARYWRNAPEAVRDFVVPAIHQYYAGREQVERDEAMRSCGLAGMTLMLAAKEMGYDTCPMDGFDFEAVARLIKLPRDHVISFMIAVGKAVKEPWPRGGQLPLSEVLITDRFGG